MRVFMCMNACVLASMPACLRVWVLVCINLCLTWGDDGIFVYCKLAVTDVNLPATC